MTDTRKEILSWTVDTKIKDDERINAQASACGVRVDRNHWYDEDMSHYHSFEIIRPDILKHEGVVIDIHGGAWIYGDKELNEHYAMALSAEGYNVLSVSYRLLPETDLIGQEKDIFSFFSYITEHEKELDIDLSKVLLTGDSAGAHLSALAYAIMHNEEMQKAYGIENAQKLNITLLCLSHPVMNLFPLGSMGKDKEEDDIFSVEMQRMMTGLDKPEESPIYRLMSFDDFADKVKWPRLHIISSRADSWRENTVRSLETMDKLGVPYTMRDWEMDERLSHVFHVLWWDYEESLITNREMLSCFSEC